MFLYAPVKLKVGTVKGSLPPLRKEKQKERIKRSGRLDSRRADIHTDTHKRAHTHTRAHTNASTLTNYRGKIAFVLQSASAELTYDLYPRLELFSR